MVNIAKKKLPMPAIMALVYISYCAASWFSMRGMIAYFGQQYDFPGWFVNDAWAFFLGGLIPLLVYELVSQFVYRSLSMRAGGDVASLRYGLNYAVIAANILLFALKFIYIAAPLYSTVLEIILVPTVTLAFVALYLWYAFYQNYIDRSKYAIAVIQIMGAFCVFYGLLTLINLILSVA